MLKKESELEVSKEPMMNESKVASMWGVSSIVCAVLTMLCLVYTFLDITRNPDSLGFLLGLCGAFIFMTIGVISLVNIKMEESKMKKGKGE